MNLENQESNESESIVLDLESLTTQYKNLLIQYKQAVLNYVNYLKQESTTPCGKYTSTSNNIDQECYNEIWRNGGCTQPPRQMSSQTAGMTLDDWITDTFNWATKTDYDSRMGCYGHVDATYFIVAVGSTDSNIWSNGKMVNDNLSGNIKNICTGSDGKTIIGITMNNQIVTKSSWDAPVWSAPIISYSCISGPSCSSTLLDTRTGAGEPTTLFSSGGNNYCCANKCYNKNEADCGNDKFAGVCSTGYYQTYVDAPSNGQTEVNFIAIAQGPDGTLVAIGAADHQLWTAPNLQSCWTNVASQVDEWQDSICIGPNGRIIVGNSGIPYLFYKESYKNLQNQTWIKGCQGCCQDITVAPDGTFLDAGGCAGYTDNQMWSMDSYLNLNGQWKGPYTNSCCIKSLTTIAITNYTSSSYSTATQPNYNVDSQPLTAIQGEAYWGTGAIGTQDPYTGITSVNDCSALCSSTANCTGATFNQSDHGQPMCWLRTGDSPPVVALPNDYAIIPKAKQLLMIVEDINIQLTAVNQLIQKDANNGQPLYNSQSVQRRIKTNELITQFVQLTKERERIQKLVNKYETLDRKEETGNIIVNQNYYSFYLLLALVVIIVIVLYNFVGPTQTSSYKGIFQSGGGKLGNNAYYIIFSIIFIVLFIHFYNAIKHSIV